MWLNFREGAGCFITCEGGPAVLLGGGGGGGGHFQEICSLWGPSLNSWHPLGCHIVEILTGFHRASQPS